MNRTLLHLGFKEKEDGNHLVIPLTIIEEREFSTPYESGTERNLYIDTKSFLKAMKKWYEKYPEDAQ